MNGGSQSVAPPAIVRADVDSSAGALSACHFAEALADFDPQRSDAGDVAKARMAVIKAIGQSLAGSSSSSVQALLKAQGIAGTGRSLIFGTDRYGAAPDATFVNATGAAATGHVTTSSLEAAIVVTLFALGEERRSTGRELLDAVLVAADTAGRLSKLAGSGDASMSPSLGSIAYLSGTAAASRLLKLDRNRTVAALLISAMFGENAVHKDSFGLAALAIGHRARASLFSALLAEAMDDGTCAGLARDRGAVVLFDVSERPRPPEFGDRPSATGIVDNMFESGKSPQSDLWDDFESCVKSTLPRDQIGPLFECLETIDKVTELAKVSRLMQTLSGGRAAEAKVVFAPRGTHEAEETNWVP